MATPLTTREQLDLIWQRNLPVLQQRLATLDAAAAAARSGTLATGLRSEAAEEAHKLAGSLGMFGYHAATDLAREIEVLLESPAPPEPERLSLLTQNLRTTLFPPSIPPA